MKSKQSIASLFKKGSYFVYKPVQFRFIVSERDIDDEDAPLMQAAFVVPKRKFKKAIDRNLLKRRMIAAFRQNKSILHNELRKHNKKISLLFIYHQSHKRDFTSIQIAVINFFEKIKRNELS